MRKTMPIHVAGIVGAFLVLWACLPVCTLAAEPVTDFESLTDVFMDAVLADYHVAGAAIAVVKDGSILLQKGYGYADMEQGISVDPEKTGFQIASVSKLITATAVMKLVDEGKLDLDADINTYLTAFQVDNPFPNPVTLRHLLTHTSGLDDRMPLYLQSDGSVLFDQLDSLENMLKKSLPPVVREPGSFCQYNVMGMALAGHVAEAVSGIPFDRYVTEEILLPLGMNHSSYGLTEKILPHASKSYQYRKGEYVQGGYTLNSNHPSGAIFASASDMAKFMLLHLEGNSDILSKKSIEQMHTHQYPGDERLTGYGLGFYETMRNGHRTIEHGGYLPRFSSKLTLLPEQGLGMFIVLNTDSPASGGICNEYVDLFYEYFTESAVGTEETVFLDLNAKEISGKYSMEEFALTDSTKIKSLLMTCDITCDESGSLHFAGSGLSWDFQYVGDGMFYSQDTGNYCRFSKSGNRWILNILGTDHIKNSAAEQAFFRVFLICQPVFALTLLFLVISWMRRAHWRSLPGPTRKLRLSVMVICALDILYLALILAMPILLMLGNTALLLTVTQPLTPVIGWLYMFAVLTALWMLIGLWTKRNETLTGRVFYTLLWTCMLCTAIFMVMMNGLVVLKYR